MDELFQASHVKEALKSTQQIIDVNARRRDSDTHVFEVSVEEHCQEIESLLEHRFSEYGPTIERDVSTNGNPLYRLIITGLIDDL